MKTPVEGFSKLSKEEKIDWIAQNCTEDPKTSKQLLERYWNTDPQVQKLHDEFIENTLSNYYLPFAVAPNFLIDGEIYAIPMAIEESSVVAAASKAAKFGWTGAVSRRRSWAQKKWGRSILSIKVTQKS